MPSLTEWCSSDFSLMFHWFSIDFLNVDQDLLWCSVDSLFRFDWFLFVTMISVRDAMTMDGPAWESVYAMRSSWVPHNSWPFNRHIKETRGKFHVESQNLLTVQELWGITRVRRLGAPSFTQSSWLKRRIFICNLQIIIFYCRIFMFMNFHDRMCRPRGRRLKSP